MLWADESTLTELITVVGVAFLGGGLAAYAGWFAITNKLQANRLVAIMRWLIKHFISFSFYGVYVISGGTYG
jgi:heme O synthase-like polyprenyltransferase